VPILRVRDSHSTNALDSDLPKLSKRLKRKECHLLAFMEGWQHEGLRAVEKEMRPLLRDYIEMLLLTGMRHGTEAMGISWRHLEWHTGLDPVTQYRRHV
jgi:hypothetical protein